MNKHGFWCTHARIQNTLCKLNFWVQECIHLPFYSVLHFKSTSLHCCLHLYFVTCKNSFYFTPWARLVISDFFIFANLVGEMLSHCGVILHFPDY